jgi:hypothetical protein
VEVISELLLTCRISTLAMAEANAKRGARLAKSCTIGPGTTPGLRSYARQRVEIAGEPPSGDSSYVFTAIHGEMSLKWRCPAYPWASELLQNARGQGISLAAAAVY